MRKGTNDESGFGNVDFRVPVEHVGGDPLIQLKFQPGSRGASQAGLWVRNPHPPFCPYILNPSRKHGEHLSMPVPMLTW